MNNSKKKDLIKEMEYEDAPSGTVTLYNYKEPFMRYENGYGFQGVLLFDSNDDKVQCHLCGEWFAYLPAHLKKEYNMRASDYKDMVGLSQSTALIGEKQRAVLIQNGLDSRIKNLKVPKRVSEDTRKKISKSLKSLTRERQNLLGTCPEQLLERLRQAYYKYGHTPSDKRGEIKGKETIVKVFGSYEEACKRAGVPYSLPGKNLNYDHIKSKVVKADIIQWIRDSLEKGSKPIQKHYATSKGIHANTVWSAVKNMGGWNTLIHEALVTGSYQKVSHHRYTKDELLKFLVDFKKHNGRNPSVSDCKRGLLPHASRYIYYWGGWKSALNAAGI